MSDAQSLMNALEIHLGLLSRRLASEQASPSLVGQLGDGVELCKQLACLLAGAIGCYSSASRTYCPTLAAVPLAELVETVVTPDEKQGNRSTALVLGESPRDLWVLVDRGLTQAALESLLAQGRGVFGPAAVARVSWQRCGGYAVLSVRLSGADGTEGDLEQGERLFEELRSLAALLQAQGGHLDVQSGELGALIADWVLPIAEDEIDEAPVSGIAFAEGDLVDRGAEPASEQKRSETMMVKSDRFGAIEVDGGELLSFPSGIIGFPQENQFILVRKANSQMIGWLQSVQTSYLTLPVVSVHAFTPRFPDVALEEFTERAGLGANNEELAVLAVLSAPPGLPATVNLMAPIVVNAITRVGAQLMLEGTRFSTRELFVLPAASPIVVESTEAPPPVGAQPESATTAAE